MTAALKQMLSKSKCLLAVIVTLVGILNQSYYLVGMIFRELCYIKT